MSSSEASDEDIIGFKAQPRYTNIDFREKLALNAEQVRELRELCALIEDEEDFELHIVVLLHLLSNLKSDHIDKSCMDLENMMLLQLLASSSSSSSSDLGSDSGGLDMPMPASGFNMSEDDGLDIRMQAGGSDILMSESSGSSSASSVGFQIKDFIILQDDELDMKMLGIKMPFPELSAVMSDMETSFKDEDGYGNLITVFSLFLGCSLLELDTFCTRLIDITAIRLKEWNEVQLSTQSPKRNRTIAELGPDCYHYTRLNQDELMELKELMFGDFQEDTYVFCKNKFTYEETLLIALHYMSSGTKYLAMKDTYGGDWTRYSYIVNWFSKFLFHKYYHRLCGKSLQYWASSVPEFRERIWRYVCFDEMGNQVVDVELEDFRIFGFIDAMQHKTCCPGSGPINAEDDRRDDAAETQRAFFTSYGKMWGMKSQAVLLPNGMVGSTYFTSVAQNDKGLVNISGIEEELEIALENYKLHNDTQYPALYGDEIYEISSVIVRRNRGQGTLFENLTSARIDIEHIFGSTAMLWKRLGVKHTWRILEMKNRIKEHLFSIFFMVNVYTCFRGNKTSTKFQFPPTRIEEYLSVDETDWYNGDDAHEYMIEHLQKQY